ncbi:unnamed protein product, partial [Oikopleura dioica]
SSVESWAENAEQLLQDAKAEDEDEDGPPSKKKKRRILFTKRPRRNLIVSKFSGQRPNSITITHLRTPADITRGLFMFNWKSPSVSQLDCTRLYSL